MMLSLHNPTNPRQVVFHVAAALRAHPELAFLDQVLEFVGVNDSGAGGAGGARLGGAGGGPGGAGEGAGAARRGGVM